MVVLDNTKIMLSPDELLLAQNSDWILTKRTIIEKAVQLLADLSGKIRPVIVNYEKRLPAAVIASEPRISKGESYLLLPYVLLDYPRCFDKENIFAIRTMFWLGNFFSITVHLSCGYKTEYAAVLIDHIDELQDGGYYICVNDGQWHHHFEPGNYFLAAGKNKGELEDMIQQRSFIKIARKFSLAQWNEMPAILDRSFSAMMELMTPSAP